MLECRGDADPSPVYTWYKDGDLLTPERMGDLGVNLISNEEHSQLEFPSPTNIQEGFYHCEARNDLGKNNNHKMFFVFSLPFPCFSYFFEDTCISHLVFRSGPVQRDSRLLRGCPPAPRHLRAPVAEPPQDRDQESGEQSGAGVQSGGQPRAGASVDQEWGGHHR